MFLIILLLTFPKYLLIDLDIVVQQSWSSKTITVGFRDNLLFKLSAPDLAARWKINHEEQSEALNEFPDPRMKATETFDITVNMVNGKTKTIIIKVIVKNQREGQFRGSIWAIKNEMLTVTSMSSCTTYSFNGVPQDIQSDISKNIHHISGAFRIVSVTSIHIGRHSCDRVSLYIIGFKNKKELQMEDRTTTQVIPEIQYIIVLPPYSNDNGHWNTDVIDMIFGNQVSYLQTNRSLLLMFDSFSKNFNVVYISHQGWLHTMTVVVRSLKPVLDIVGSKIIIQKHKATIRCRRLHSYTGLVLGKLIILDQGYRVYVSNKSNISVSFIPVSKNGPSLIKCINQIGFNGRRYQFENSIDIHVLSPLMVYTNATFEGYTGQYLAIALNGVTNHSNFQICWQEEREIKAIRNIPFVETFVLLRYPLFRNSYINLDGKRCEETSRNRLTFVLMISPLIAFPNAHILQSIVMVSDSEEAINVDLKIQRRNRQEVSLFLDSSEKIVPIQNSISLFMKTLPGTYGTTQFIVYAKNAANLKDQMPKEYYLHSIFLIPYIKILWSETTINIYVGEFVAFCSSPINPNDVCEIVDGTDIIEESFHKQRFRYNHECLLFEARNVETFKWKCEPTMNVDVKKYTWNINVIAFPKTARFTITSSEDTFIIRCAVDNDDDDPSSITVNNPYIYPTYLINYHLEPEFSSDYKVNTPMKFVEEMTCKIKFMVEPENIKRVVYQKKTAYIMTKIHLIHTEEESYDLDCYGVNPDSESISWIDHSISDQSQSVSKHYRATFTTPKFNTNAKYSCIWENITHIGHILHVLRVVEPNTIIDVTSDTHSQDSSVKLQVTCRVSFKKPSNLPGSIILTNTNSPSCEHEEMSTCAHSKLHFRIGTVTSMTVMMTLDFHTIYMKFQCDVVTSESTHSEMVTESLGENTIIIIYPTTPNLQVTSQSRLLLECVIQSTGNHTITSKLVWKNNKNETLHDSDTVNNLYVIESVDIADAGRYTCEFQFGVEKRIISRNINIVVSDKVMPTLLASLNTGLKILSPYDTFTVSCIVLNYEHASRGILEITNGQPNCKLFKRCVEIGYSRDKNRLTLTISNPDNFQDKTYICRAKVSDSIIEETINISIAANPYIAISKDPEFINLKVDNKIIVQCCIIAEYALPRKIIWTHHLSETVGYTHHSYANCSNTSIVKDGVDNDNGRFYCSAIVNGKTIYNYTTIINKNDDDVSARNGENLNGEDDDESQIENDDDIDSDDNPEIEGVTIFTIPQDTPLKLKCKVKIGNREDIIWTIHGNIININQCIKATEDETASTYTYSCSVVIHELGTHAADCVSSSHPNHKLKTMRFNVVPKPSISHFDYYPKLNETLHDDLKNMIICNATGFVTELTISVVENGSSKKPLTTRTISITDTEYSNIKSIDYTMSKMEMKELKRFECIAVAKTVYSFASPVSSIKSLTIDDSDPGKNNVRLYIAIPILMIPIIGCGIACIWFYRNPLIKFSRKQEY